MFQEPTSGSEVILTVENPREYYKTFLCHIPSHTIFRGIKIPSANYDQPNTWRIKTGNKFHPVSVIPVNQVTNIEYVTGQSTGKETFVPKTDTDKSWRVKGSGDKKYIVSRTNGKFTCDCVGFQYRSQCKHIHKVYDFLKKKEA